MTVLASSSASCGPRPLSPACRWSVVALSFVALLVAGYRSRMDLRSQARVRSELLDASASPLKFPPPEDKTKAPRATVAVSAPGIPPPVPLDRPYTEVLPGYAPQERATGHPLRAPPISHIQIA